MFHYRIESVEQICNRFTRQTAHVIITRICSTGLLSGRTRKHPGDTVKTAVPVPVPGSLINCENR